MIGPGGGAGQAGTSSRPALSGILRSQPLIGLEDPLRLHALLWICFAGASAPAQTYGPPLGMLRLSFDSTQYVDRVDVEEMQDFSWYCQVAIDFGSPALNASDGLLLWESAISIPPQIAVLSVDWLAPYTFCDTCSNSDWRVYLAACVFAEDTPKAILRFNARLLTSVDDLVIALGPASPSNFGSTAPGWHVCAGVGNPAVDLHPFASGWSQQLVVNSSVAQRVESWSATKARY